MSLDMLSLLLGENQEKVLKDVSESAGVAVEQVQQVASLALPKLQSVIQSKMFGGGEAGALNISELLAGLSKESEEGSDNASSVVSMLSDLLGGEGEVSSFISNIASETRLEVGAVTSMLPKLLRELLKSVQSFFAGGEGGGIDLSAIASVLGGNQVGGNQVGGNQVGGLGSLLDTDNDGSVADDLIGFAKKLF